LITGTAQGSFGFQLEEAAQQDLTLFQQAQFDEPTPLEAAMGRTMAIMEASLGTDDELTEAVAEADPRALEALRKFLDEMSRNEAVCTLEFKDDAFRFADVAQLRRTSERLRQTNIQEAYESLKGVFLGVLPEHRRFEFRVSESRQVISGKVGGDIENAAEINQFIDKPVTIRVHTRRIGQGRPYYILTGFSPGSDENGQE
jgi:hypothetical protein